jgi:hypothetical protein
MSAYARVVAPPITGHRRFGLASSMPRHSGKWPSRGKFEGTGVLRTACSWARKIPLVDALALLPRSTHSLFEIVSSQRRLINLRNAIVHEGAAFQFSVDDDLRIHPQAQSQTVSLSEEDSFASINRIAAALYAPYIEKFIGRELNDIEVSTLEGLRGTKA